MRINKGAKTLWVMVLALAVLVTLSMPFALSRYVSAGVGDARARVAKWGPRVDLGAVPEAGKTVLLSDVGWAWVSPCDGDIYNVWNGDYWTFRVQPPDNGNSEVRARFDYKMTYADGSDIPDSTIRADGNWWLSCWWSGGYHSPGSSTGLTSMPLVLTETLAPGAASSGAVVPVKLFFHWAHRPNTFFNVTGREWGYQAVKLNWTATQVD